MKFILSILSVTFFFCGLSARLDTSWWKDTVIYNIVVPAYKDHDGDGMGDFEGIISKLDYIENLKISVLQLSSIFASSEVIDNNYPIEDFQNTHVGVGSLQDFDNFIKETNARGIRVILDLPINHCSCEHEWFKKSQTRIEPYTDYFVWTNGSESWSSGSKVWEYDETRKQYYYHWSDKTTADLNLKNEAVKNEIKDLMTFWLDRGVAGFNLGVWPNIYIEDEEAKQQQYPSWAIVGDRPESYEFVHELREHLDRYNKKHDGYQRILVLEKRQIEKFPNLRGNETYPIANLVYTKFFGSDNDYTLNYLSADRMNKIATDMISELENGQAMTVFEGPTLKRTPNRFQDRQYLDLCNTFLYMLPGTMHVYYGQEIGISSWKFTYEQKINAMHWDQSANAGFTDGEISFYTPNFDYWKINVENFKNTESSTFKSTRELIELKKTKAVRLGDLKTYNVSNYVFALSRSYDNVEKFITIINLSNVLYDVDLTNDLPEKIPSKMQIVASTPNSILRTGQIIDKKNKFTLRPVSAIVIDASANKRNSGR